MKSSQAIVPILFLLVSTVSATSTPPVQVSCSKEEMKIEVDLTGRNVQDSKYTIYLDKLKHFPGCRMEMKSSTSGVLILPLDSDHLYSCGLTRLQNKVTGTKIFYHRLVIEERKRRPGSSSSSPSSSHLSSSSASPSQSSSSSLPPSVDPKDTRSNHTSRSSGSDHSHSNSASSTGHSTEEGHESFDHEDHGDHRDQNSHHSREGDNESEYTDITQEIMVVKCVIPGHHSRLVKRQSGSGLSFPIWELPDNFTESSEELIDFSGNVTARAPLPLLNIGVRQNGEFVDTALNVSPGTPLEMVIYLDEVSASVYGLLTSFLRVTDNTPRKQEEVIILNGCSIDPYIFANFETEDGGKSVSAKFRAFKFPDTNYVLFVGTVNVCIKSCLPVNCGEGIFGYGKRRRRRGVDPRTSQLDGPTTLPQDPSKVFEAELSTFINVGYDSDLKSLPLQSKRDKLYQPVVTDTKVTYEIPSSHSSSSRNSKQYKNKQGKNNSTSLTTDPFIVSSIILFSFIVTVFVTESNLIRKY